MKFSVREYLTADGKSPYREWLEEVDTPVRFCPGYRVYFGRHGRTVILLLLGGDKSSQAKDIREARKHWVDFLEAKRHGKA